MKKIMIVLLALVLCSCVKEENIKDFREAKFEVFNRIVHFSYKSHDYIMFRDGVGDYSVAGIVHDPDCKCNDSKK